MLNWTSGARSLDTLLRNGWFTFSVPAGVTSVVAGLNTSDESTNPDDITHGFFFASGQYRVVERGDNQTAAASYTSADEFHIVRAGTRIFYCKGSTPTTAPGVFFPLPGAVVFTSSVASGGEIFLDASLLGVGDSVTDFSRTIVNGEGGEVTLSFEPLQVSGSQGAFAEAVFSFEPLVLDARLATQASVSFEPLQVLASEAVYAQSILHFKPLQVAAYQTQLSTDFDGASLSFEPMIMFASGDVAFDSIVSVDFELMQMVSSENAHSEAVISFQSMIFFAEGESVPNGPRFDIVLPAFIAALPETSDIAERTAVSSTISSRNVVLVRESARAQDRLRGTASNAAQVVSERAGTADAARFSIFVRIADSVAVGDSSAVTIGARVRELASALDGVRTLQNTRVQVAESVVAKDAVSLRFAQSVSEIALVSDAHLISTAVRIYEQAIAGDAFLLSGVGVTLRVAESFCARDAQGIQTISRAKVSDRAAASDRTYFRTPGLLAWVMNTETGGVSWYENWSFTDMAVLNGKVFAVGPEGLAVVGGDRDASSDIAAKVAWGFNDFGGYSESGAPQPDDQKKRINNLWFGYRSDGVLRATVETYGQNQPPTSYTMLARPAAQPYNNRVVPGKGLNARYWRMAVENTAGCDFEVTSVTADTLTSTRRY